MKWNDILSQTAKDTAIELCDKIQQEREEGKNICPPQDRIFAALAATPPDRVKVVIIGQDPYHTPGQANGLAFSVAPTAPLQPSLRNIFKELQEDMECGRPSTGDLTPWAERGVLLLNTSLTVYAGQANSHAGWWKNYTSEIVRLCALELPQPIVFLAWGKFAQDLIGQYIPAAGWEQFMSEHKKVVIPATHPSPFSANRASSTAPAFIGSKPFSKANKFLMQMGSEPLDWSLP